MASSDNTANCASSNVLLSDNDLLIKSLRSLCLVSRRTFVINDTIPGASASVVAQTMSDGNHFLSDCVANRLTADVERV